MFVSLYNFTVRIISGLCNWNPFEDDSDIGWIFYLVSCNAIVITTETLTILLGRFRRCILDQLVGCKDDERQ